MRRLRALIVKEFIQMRRDPLTLAMLMLIPIYFIVRDWWTEAEDATLERVPGVEDPPRRDD